jgi:hypothetical protein
MPMPRAPLPLEALPPSLGPFFATDDAKVLLVAKGMAPGLAAQDLGIGIYQASQHPNPKIAEAARATAAGLPDPVLSGALPAIDVPVVLDFFAEVCAGRSDHLQRILLNRHTADETVVELARTMRVERLLELVAQNEQRLLRCPKIVEALYLNRFTRMSSANRCVELAIRHGIPLDIPAYKELAAALGAETKYADAGDQALAEAAADQAFQDAINEDKELAETSDEAVVETEDQELRQRINLLGLTIAQKIRLSMIGTAYHRSLLLRDPNRVVAMAAIKAPGVKETEIIRVTQSRSANDDVIRIIAANREWLKLYQVKANLAANPKCPLATAMRLLPYLRLSDLRNLARSKNVPSALSTAAKNMVSKKG